MAYHFGDDTSSGFDWSSLLSNVVSTAGQVTTAVINKGAQVTGTTAVGTTAVKTSTTSSTSTSTMLLLGVAAVAAFVLFSRKRR